MGLIDPMKGKLDSLFHPVVKLEKEPLVVFLGILDQLLQHVLPLPKTQSLDIYLLDLAGGANENHLSQSIVDVEKVITPSPQSTEPLPRVEKS